MPDVDAGTIAIYADIACPWSHVALFRLHRARARLRRDDDVRFDLRAFPLEVFNERPTPKRTLDAETPVCGALEPDAGWRMWARHDHDYPVTTLLALEAVQASKAQGLAASEQLDRALRVALFARSRNISMRHEILEAAQGCDGLDAGKLGHDLDRGVARHLVFEHAEEAREVVEGSPHLFLPDGSGVHNPGIQMHWEGSHGQGFPVVDEDEPGIYEELLERASRRKE